MKRIWLGIGIVFIILLAFPQTRAQDRQTEGAANRQAYTETQLKQKYKQIDPIHYLVRPGIVMTVSFSSEGQASLLKIMAAQSSPQQEGSAKLMSLGMVALIIDELSPPETRGRLIRTITFSGGCTSVQASIYDSVTISMTIVCNGEGDNHISSADINWKSPSDR
jgi:hypothetical protein